MTCSIRQDWGSRLPSDGSEFAQRMTKTDITLDLARELGISKKEAKVVLEIILDTMARALRKGERVELRGFGSFNVYTRPARKGRNPATGAPLNVPPKAVPAFRPSKELKSLINAMTGHAAQRSGRVRTT